MEEAVDRKKTRTQFTFDHAGRMTKQIEDYGTGTVNRETEFTDTADNQLKTLTAQNNVTLDQVTTWVYGTTLSDSGVARNDLVRAMEFPDKSSASDRVEYKYSGQASDADRTSSLGTMSWPSLRQSAPINCRFKDYSSAMQ